MLRTDFELIRMVGMLLERREQKFVGNGAIEEEHGSVGLVARRWVIAVGVEKGDHQRQLMRRALENMLERAVRVAPCALRDNLLAQACTFATVKYPGHSLLRTFCRQRQIFAQCNATQMSESLLCCTHDRPAEDNDVRTDCLCHIAKKKNNESQEVCEAYASEAPNDINLHCSRLARRSRVSPLVRARELQQGRYAGVAVESRRSTKATQCVERKNNNRCVICVVSLSLSPPASVS